MPIVSTVAMNMRLRPTRSPKCPVRTAPTGRARNPVKNTTKESNVPVSRSSSGKKTRLKTRPAAIAYAMKS
jgi:hypothetical protein